MENILYIGKTAFYDSHHYFNESLTCIAYEFDQVYQYLSLVRGLPVVSEDPSELESLPQANGVCGIIMKAAFYSGGMLSDFIYNPQHEPLMMVLYGKIDPKIAGISKKEAKEIWVPEIVSEIIEEDLRLTEDSIGVAAHTLKELLYYLNGVSKDSISTNSEVKQLYRTIQLLDGYQQDINKAANSPLLDGYYRRASILFCGEAEYRKRVEKMMDYKRRETEYRNALGKY